MRIADVMAISGLPGLFRLVGNRSNGLIVEDMDSGKVRFVSSRKHQFSPLDSISIYTLGDTVPLKQVFQIMLDKKTDHPPIPHKSDKMELYEYFENILPEYDEDKVRPQDIKKIIQWFGYMEKLNLFAADEEE